MESPTCIKPSVENRYLISIDRHGCSRELSTVNIQYTEQLLFPIGLVSINGIWSDALRRVNSYEVLFQPISGTFYFRSMDVVMFKQYYERLMNVREHKQLMDLHEEYNFM